MVVVRERAKKAYPGGLAQQTCLSRSVNVIYLFIYLFFSFPLPF
jgi:hypothetical protein